MTTYNIGGGGGTGFVTDEYKKGWYDGYQAAKRDLTNTQHYLPPLNPAVCKSCGKDLSKLNHYNCMIQWCPSKIAFAKDTATNYWQAGLNVQTEDKGE